jgi:hypothetical protein
MQAWPILNQIWDAMLTQSGNSSAVRKVIGGQLVGVGLFGQGVKQYLLASSGYSDRKEYKLALDAMLLAEKGIKAYEIDINNRNDSEFVDQERRVLM